MKIDKEREEILREILSVSPVNPHGRYKVTPRVGKTRLAIELIKRDKPKSILWVTPQKELAETEIPKEFITWKAKSYLKKLTTVTWKSLAKCTGSYDLIVLDEEQCITENNSTNLFDGTLDYRNIISMTGTQTKDESKVNIYDRLYLKPIYSMDIEDAVERNIVSDYTINVVKIPLPKEKTLPVTFKKDGPTVLTSEWDQYRYWNNRAETAIFNRLPTIKMLIGKRRRLIYESNIKTSVAKSLFSKLKGRKMAFSGTQKQAENISNNFYHNKVSNENLLKFIDEEIDELSLVNKGGVGVTYRNVQHLVLVQADSDNNGMTTQKIFRVLLKQEGVKPTIWVLCLEGTKDEVWVSKALESFDTNKINTINLNELKDYVGE